MPGTIVRRRQARQDIIDCASRIAEDVPHAAAKFLDAVEASLARLVEFPGMGRVCEFETGELPGIHMWPVKGFETFLLFYQVIPDGIRLVRLLHGARDIEAALGEGS